MEPVQIDLSDTLAALTGRTPLDIAGMRRRQLTYGLTKRELAFTVDTAQGPANVYRRVSIVYGVALRAPQE